MEPLISRLTKLLWAVLVLLFVLLLLIGALIFSIPGDTTTIEAWLGAPLAGTTWALTTLPPLVSWPIVILVLVIYLGRSRSAADRIARLFGRFRSVRALGAEVTFSEEGARQLSISAEDAFAEFRRQADHEFAKQSRTHDLRTKLEKILTVPMEIAEDDKIRACLQKQGFRCTVHVADILFHDTLYQLLDYYPKRGLGGAGRRFSTRYGIIGKAWRSRQHHCEAQARHAAEELIEEWGMTAEEAQASTKGRPAYLCVILTDASLSAIGILFMDATEEFAFGTQEEGTRLAEAIASKCGQLGFTEALARVANEIRRYSADIRIHG